MSIYNRARLFVLAYDEAGDTVTGGGGTDTITGGGADDKNQPPSFTPVQQEYINGLLKKEREETARKEAKKIEDALKSKDLSDKKRKDLNDQLENLRSTFLSKEQQAQESLERERKGFKDKEGELNGQVDLWKGRYTTSTIKRSITDAAIENDSYDPLQIEALLFPQTSLVEELDEEGKPNGNLIPKVKFTDTDKEGKSVILEISPSEAVKKMRAMQRFGNLFRTKAAGGLGGSNSGNRGAMDIRQLAKDPAAYREARKHGKI